MYVHAKNQKILTIRYWENSEKPYFGAILGPFWPKMDQKIYRKYNLMLSYLNIYYFVTSCKKSENFNKSMERKSQKHLFWGQFGPILAQNRQKNLSKKNLMLSYLNSYYFVSSCKKSENFSHSMARKSQKTLFLGQFGPIWAQNGPKTGQKNYRNNF